MMKNIKGKFEIKGSPLEIDEATQIVGAMRMRFDKQFSGALDAQSTVTFLGILDKASGSGGYVGLERVEGSVDGRKGTFLLQHSCTMSQGRQEQNITVIPGSGQGELVGISGKMLIENKENGDHFYSFDYLLA